MTLFRVIFCLFFSQIWANDALDPRIVEGVIANKAQFPYAVAIYYQTPDGQYFCTGSLINNRWVLTAAHCLEGALHFRILLGVNSLTSSNALVVNTTTYVIHPKYDPKLLKNDIGLISLEREITFSDTIQAVELPTEQLKVGDYAIAVGWGSAKDHQLLPSDQLFYVSLSVISTAVCRRTYGDYIQDNMICLSGVGNEGICNGDSGGPLVQIPDRTAFQVGVASFYSGAGCETEHPSGYTSVFEYIDWIKEVTSSASIVTSVLPLIIFTVLLLYYISFCNY